MLGVAEEGFSVVLGVDEMVEFSDRGTSVVDSIAGFIESMSIESGTPSPSASGKVLTGVAFFTVLGVVSVFAHSSAFFKVSGPKIPSSLAPIAF